ncbi:MAG: serine/threonine protein kinase, partial [Candidatus Spyradocola sp.]
VYPPENSAMAPALVERFRKQCDAFFDKKRELYRSIRMANNGNMIVPLDFFRYETRYYLVTEKVDTANLPVADICRLPFEKRLLIMKIVAYSIECLSRVGVVHADLKPDNLLVKKTRSGGYTVKLIDFDSSFFANRACEVEELQGDQVYIAPETFLRICGEDVEIDQKADVFALGILFHQFLCGSLPQFPEEEEYVHIAVLNDQPVTLDASIPEPLRTMIGDMLRKDPAERPDISAVRQRLNAWGAPPAAPVRTPPPPAAPVAYTTPVRQIDKQWYVPDDLD